MMTIDMHAHWFPEALADAFRQRSVRPRIYRHEDGREFMEGLFNGPFNNIEALEARLADMDRNAIERAVISVPPVYGMEGLPVAESVPLCRIVTDALSDLCERHPDRFSALASLPVADIGTTVAEFERAMALPGVVGALLPGDGFLSLKRAEKFRPLFEEADRRGAIFLIHYGKIADDPDAPKVDASDNGHPRVGTLDMQARLSQNMITFCLTDFLAAFPNVTVLSHNLGGNIPYEIERMDHRWLMDKPGGEMPSKRFRAAPVLVDCNSLGARAIELAAEVYGTDKIVFGSDGTDFSMDWTQKALDAARIGDGDRQAIRRGNAAAALARVRKPVRAAAE
jgi:predicted TIM-barrel fold metal-dependent hydrolase